MEDRGAGTSDDVAGAGCATLVVAWAIATVALVALNTIGVRPGEGMLAALPVMPSSAEPSERWQGEAILLGVAAIASVVPAGIAMWASAMLLERARVHGRARRRIAVALGIAVLGAYLAAIVLSPAWGWFIVAGAGPIAAVLVVLLVVGLVVERRETRAKERARDARLARRTEAAAADPPAGDATPVANPAQVPDGAQVPEPARVAGLATPAAVATMDAKLASPAEALGGREAPGDPAFDDSIHLETAAWLRARAEAQRSWSVSRRKCAAWAAVIPVAMAAIVWVIVGLGFADLRSTATDPDQRALEQGLLMVTLAVIFGGITLVAMADYARLALFGGGFEETPGGLVFRFGRAVREFEWREVGQVRVETRRSGTVLVIDFPEGGMRWPRALLLASSTTDQLCLHSSALAAPAVEVAAGIRAAVARHRDAPAPAAASQ